MGYWVLKTFFWSKEPDLADLFVVETKAQARERERRQRLYAIGNRSARWSQP